MAEADDATAAAQRMAALCGMSFSTSTSAPAPPRAQAQVAPPPAPKQQQQQKQQHQQQPLQQQQRATSNHRTVVLHDPEGGGKKMAPQDVNSGAVLRVPPIESASAAAVTSAAVLGGNTQADALSPTSQAIAFARMCGMSVSTSSSSSSSYSSSQPANEHATTEAAAPTQMKQPQQQQQQKQPQQKQPQQKQPQQKQQQTRDFEQTKRDLMMSAPVLASRTKVLPVHPSFKSSGLSRGSDESSAAVHLSGEDLSRKIREEGALQTSKTMVWADLEDEDEA